MAIIEITDKARVHALLADDPITTLDALDENALGVEGLVSVFTTDQEPAPVNMVAVRWGQKNLGLGSLALLRAARISGLEELVEGLPADRGQLDLAMPFWASPAINARFNAQVIGAEATYVVDRARLVRSPVAPQCTRLDDPHVIKPMFPKLAADAPAYVLSLKGALTAVAAVTHLREDVARVHVYTVEDARRRGFGRGVLTALAEELLALRIVPTIVVDLANEASVRMAERAGFYQRGSTIKARLAGKRELTPVAPPAPSLVQLGGGLGKR
ncbi:GNAT family N-acetyltransferase [Myxococcota bacterium]|nr:GNAT family N-acetyltransferase [Myxococcota bacterium]